MLNLFILGPTSPEILFWVAIAAVVWVGITAFECVISLDVN